MRPHVLVVHSHADSSEMYAEALHWAGFVASACAVDELEHAIAQCRPDAVVMSVRLYGTDAATVCRALKADPATAAIPIVATSASPADHEQALRDGVFTEVVLEPCSPIELGERLLRILESEHRAAPDDRRVPRSRSSGTEHTQPRAADASRPAKRRNRRMAG